MIDEDKKIVDKARRASDYNEFERLMSLVSSTEARDAILNLERSFYHHEEARCGMI